MWVDKAAVRMYFLVVHVVWPTLFGAKLFIPKDCTIISTDT